MAYGGSQARGPIGATAASLCHSHSNASLSSICNLHRNSYQWWILTHWARPRIEPVSTWIPVRFCSVEPQRDLHIFISFSFPFLFLSSFFSSFCLCFPPSLLLFFPPSFLSSFLSFLPSFLPFFFLFLFYYSNPKLFLYSLNSYCMSYLYPICNLLLVTCRCHTLYLESVLFIFFNKNKFSCK